MEALQNHILHASCTRVHKQAPNKMAAGAVSMVFHFGAWFWKASIGALAMYRQLLLSFFSSLALEVTHKKARPVQSVLT